MREEALLFGQTRSLVGILTDPPQAERGQNLPAIILLNAGLVHRVGPNRLSVKMARNLAAMGCVALRFDFSGIGDSAVRDDHLPFDKSAVSETQEAMDYLSAARGVTRFVLMGLCSGAVIALRTACCDPRVMGAVLLNAQGPDKGADAFSASIRNRTLARHYRRMAFSSSFSIQMWLKAITGKVDYRSMIRLLSFQLRDLLGRKPKVSFEMNTVAADLRLVTERGVRLLLVYSEDDPGWDYLHVDLGTDLQAWRSGGKVEIEIIPRSDHMFSLLWTQEHLLNVVQNWAHALVQD